MLRAIAIIIYDRDLIDYLRWLNDSQVVRTFHRQSVVLHKGITRHDATIGLIGEEAVDSGPQEDLDFANPISQRVGISGRPEIRR